MEFTYLIRILRPLNIKGQPTLYRSHVALIVQLGKHYSGSAKVVDSNPIQSLKILSGYFSSTVMAIVTYMTRSQPLYCVAHCSNSRENYNMLKVCSKTLWILFQFWASCCFSKQKPILVGWCHHANALNLIQLAFWGQYWNTLIRIQSSVGWLFFPSPSFLPLESLLWAL